MATASGTDAYCGINRQYAFARQQRGAYRSDQVRFTLDNGLPRDK
jgi:hypothetical protein